MGLSPTNMFRFAFVSVLIALIACYWELFILHYIYKSNVSTGFAKQIILRILCYNGSLDTWTVVNLITAKFKLLIFYLQSQSQSYIKTNFESASLSWNKAHLGLIAVRQLQACWCGALSLTRGRVCLLPDSVSSNTSLDSMYNFTRYKLKSVGRIIYSFGADHIENTVSNCTNIVARGPLPSNGCGFVCFAVVA
jgi:hypothetical protein